MSAGSFLPVATERLMLRAFRDADAAVLAAYRNDPDVARYQDWPLPFTTEQAADVVESQRRVTGPIAGDWVQIAVEHEAELVGDLAVGLDASALLATIGYSVRPDRHGRGLATEAVGALVDCLFRTGIHRVGATLDPRNVPSARLLERLGFRYEGRASGAAFVRGTWEDDDRYAILAEERASWVSRPTVPPDDVRLREIGPEDVRGMLELRTHHTQESFVAPMAASFAEALVPATMEGAPVVPWFRAIHADGVRVGFVMLAEATRHHPHPFLWRLLIDRTQQRRGIGRRVIALLVERLRAEGQTRLLTSWYRGPGGPEPFYLGLGFVPTGSIEHGEIEAALDLS